MTKRTRIVIALCTAFSFSCTLEEQEPPPLVGPSGLSISVTVAVTPDVLPTDGKSQSRVTVNALDAYGIPIRNLTLRAHTAVNGIRVEIGTLSAHSVVTDASGTAQLTYTAPAIGGEDDTGTRVEIGITPSGSNFATAITRAAIVRLVPAVPLR